MYAVYKVDTWQRTIKLIDVWVTRELANGAAKDLGKWCDSDTSYHVIGVHYQEDAPATLPFASKIKGNSYRKHTHFINPFTYPI